jgi:hypothetical protein
VKRKYRSSPARSHPVRLFVPLASSFGLVPLVPPVLGVVIVITLLHVCATEFAKRAFHHRV